MNISHNNLKYMEIPLLDITEQKQIAKEYTETYTKYKNALSEVETQWQDKFDKLQMFWDKE